MESVKQRLLLSILFLRGKSARSYCELNANQLGPVHTTTEFENGGLTLKRHQTFSVYTTLEEQITGNFEFVFVV